MKNGTELLLHEPVFSISRIGFAMPQGEVRLSATASEPGLKRAEIENRDGPQVQAALMEHLNVVADLRIDAALLNRLLADSDAGRSSPANRCTRAPRVYQARR